MENKQLLELLQMILKQKEDDVMDNEYSNVAGFAQCIKFVAQILGEDPDNYGVRD